MHPVQVLDLNLLPLLFLLKNTGLREGEGAMPPPT